MSHPFRLLTGMALLMSSFCVFAQTNVTGYVFGQVTLESGKAASRARVTLLNTQTNAQRSLATREDGSYRFSALPIGGYSISFDADGFISAERDNLVVSVGVGTRANVVLGRDEDKVVDLGVLEVLGGKISPVDVSSIESTSIFNSETLERIPVERDPAKVALLAPGTTQGDRGLGEGPLVSFGGASVAENAYYINGMDVTNFRNGLGGSTVPFEFYQEFQVKTGGYGAEFGRSTGGVVNAVTRRGGNEWTFGAGVYEEPDGWRETSPDVRMPPVTPGIVPVDYEPYNSDDEHDLQHAHAYASGPIVRDRLFFYAIVDHEKDERVDDSGPVSAWGIDQMWLETHDNDNTFWGLKLDWQINPDHLLEFTAFSDDASRAKTQYEAVFSGELEPLGIYYTDRGGDNTILRYSGHFGTSLTVSALAGVSEYDRTDSSSADDEPVTLDARPGQFPWPTDWLQLVIGTSSDERTMFRVDGEWDLGRHLLRFGTDYQQNTSEFLEQYSGGIYWRYLPVTPDDHYWFDIPEGVTEIVRELYWRNRGEFDITNTAFYIEDHWRVTDTLTLYLGLRNETFDNENAEGWTYIEMSEQLGPRLGFSWDAAGDGTAKLFGTAGRYHLPLPSDVSVNMAGVWTFREEWFALHGLNPDGSPIKGESLDLWFSGEDILDDPNQKVAQDLDPSYQDEYILGYVFEPRPGWSLGIRGIYRDLKQAIEDTNISPALNRYAAENGFDAFYVDDPWWFLINPGSDVHILWDLDFDGMPEDFVLTADFVGLPEVKRTYKAAEIFFERVWDGTWFLQGSYTYSESRGNHEGWTHSETDQENPALTRIFDLPEVMEGADGRLPNDRPHTVKLFGSWDFSDRWSLSGNFLFQSGRPYGALGLHPSGYPAQSNNAFYDHGELVPRGSRGRTDELYQLDLGLQYTVPLNFGDGKGAARFRVDVFNVFDSDAAMELHEHTQHWSGVTDTRYLLPKNFQYPRYIRLSARIDF